MTTTETVLELGGVWKGFSRHLSLLRRMVIRDLSLRLAKGEVFGFLGGNGAGKTTTIKLIMGLLFPTRGKITLFGRSVTDAKARARMGFLPENPNFYDYLTGKEFLDYYGRLYGLFGDDLRRRIGEVLELVGLAGKETLQLRGYSKGMVQRIGMAQAIINDPDLVVLDEPMSGLDPVGRRDFRDLMLALRDRGAAVFFSSHILQDAELVCDRVGILVDGHLDACGTLDDLLRDDSPSYEVQLRRVESDALGPVGPMTTTRDGSLLLKVSEDDLERLLERAVAAGGKVDRVTPLRKTLEDLFIARASHP